MISEEEFKRLIANSLAAGASGCMNVRCGDCPVHCSSCANLPAHLKFLRWGPPRKDLFNAYLNGRIVIVNREWCVVEED